MLQTTNLSNHANYSNKVKFCAILQLVTNPQCSLQKQFLNLKIKTPIEIFLVLLDKNYQSKKMEILETYKHLNF